MDCDFGTKTKENLFRSEKYFVKMSVGVCYVNLQNLKFRSWRGAEIDAVKVEANFSKNGFRQVKKFSFFLLFLTCHKLEISMKSRWNFAEISRRFHDWPFQIWKFSSLPIRRKMTFPKLTFSLLKSENVQGSKRGEILRDFWCFSIFVTKSKENVRWLRWFLEGI